MRRGLLIALAGLGAVAAGCGPMRNAPPAPLAKTPVDPGFTSFVSSVVSIFSQVEFADGQVVSGGTSVTLLLRAPSGRIALGAVESGDVGGVLAHRMQFLLLPTEVVDAVRIGGDLCVLRSDARVQCTRGGEKRELGVEADAERLFLHAGEPCVIRSGGAWACYSRREDGYSPNEQATKSLGQLGPAAEPVPDSRCFIGVDRTLHCFDEEGFPKGEAITDVAQASVGRGEGDFGGGCAALASGKVKCWGGMNDTGVLGNGERGPIAETTATVLDLDDAVAVVRTADHACALTKAHVVKCWGSADGYAYGDAALASATTLTVCDEGEPSGPRCIEPDFLGKAPNHVHLRPIAVPELEGVVSLAAGPRHTCGVRSDGRVLCVGGDHPGAWTIDVGEK